MSMISNINILIGDTGANCHSSFNDRFGEHIRVLKNIVESTLKKNSEFKLKPIK